MPKHLPPIAGLALALALAGCGKPQSERKLDQLDAQLLANEADPALTGSLGDAIVVDPAKAGARPGSRSNGRPAPSKLDGAAKSPPPIAPAGPTLGELARAQAKRSGRAPAVPAADAGPVSGECYAELGYAASWAAKLPRALALYPGAALREAAGNDRKGCAIRIVSFTAPAGWHDVAGWYAARAAKAGWSVATTERGGDHVVAGTAPDGSAFYLTLAGHGAKASVADMIVSLGH